MRSCLAGGDEPVERDLDVGHRLVPIIGRLREQLADDLQAWCYRAEESGITALREFSMKLRATRA